jgi:ASC-1-like (ASCH) protein
LFVPLANEPFDWFVQGKKKWELRRRGRQYTRRHVRIGRPVELRRGYRNGDTLWGEIVNVIEADGIEEFFRKVPFLDVIPVAKSVGEAIAISSEILGVDVNTPLLGFAIGRTTRELLLSNDLIPSVLSGNKTSTVRLGRRSYGLGEARIVSREIEIPIEITNVSHTKMSLLNEEDARSEGYRCVRDLVLALRRFYPQIDDDSDVTIVRFRQR